MRHRSLALTAACACLALPATASAGTASVRVYESIGGKGVPTTHSSLARFDGAGAEANALTVTREPQAVVFRDTGASIAPGNGCKAVDANTVRCEPLPSAPGISVEEVELGDGDDSFSSSGSPYGITAHGGAGDDVLTGSGAEFDFLTGDDGDDTLIGTDGKQNLVGGEGNDRLFGGGNTDELGGGPGDDLIDGGDGTDIATWSERTDPVRVDLADPAPDGSAGEADTLVGVENVRGGLGADTLRGDDGPNHLDAGRGKRDDVLIGRGGDDHLTGGPGNDRLIGKDGNDVLIDTHGTDRFDGGTGDDQIDQYTDSVRTPDRFTCGPGADTLDSPQATDFVPRDCERVDVYIETLSPVYDDSDRYVRFDYHAPGGEEGYGCGVIRLGTPAGSLGRGAFKIPARGGRRVRVPLTERGRRALRGSRPVRIQVRFDIVGCPPRSLAEPDFSAGYQAAF